MAEKEAWEDTVYVSGLPLDITEEKYAMNFHRVQFSIALTCVPNSFGSSYLLGRLEKFFGLSVPA